MIALVDPAIFLPSHGEAFIEQQVNEVIQICRERNATIPDLPEYWTPLYSEFLKPLANDAESRSLRGGVSRMRDFVKKSHFSNPPQESRIWGLRQLFQCDIKWFGIMESLFLKVANSGRETIFIGCLLKGRNLIIHDAGGCILYEKTRWRIHVQIPSKSPAVIPCVLNRRNIHVPWTCRYDNDLPDSGGWAFRPSDRWWRKDTLCHGTRQGRPAWLDRDGNGWARPRAGGNQHWDLYIDKQTVIEKIGLDQLNIASAGTPNPGSIHHVPASKEGRLKIRDGWP
jgi:hypothetical protein